MQDNHNILTQNELRVIADKEFFQLKRQVTKKIEMNLAVLGTEIEALLVQYPPQEVPEVTTIAPKISRGESYKGFPWLVLDYPRMFTDKNVFAFRSMFWWGHYFSFTVHISGTYLQRMKRKLEENISTLHGKDFYLYIHHDPWQHHYDSSNYTKLDALTAQEQQAQLTKQDFIKLGRTLPLNNFPEMIRYGKETYEAFLK